MTLASNTLASALAAAAPRTGPALQDLLGTQVDVTFGTPPPFMPYVQAGKPTARAITRNQRVASLPDVSVASEVGFPKLDATSWFAVYAPAKTLKSSR